MTDNQQLDNTIRPTVSKKSSTGPRCNNWCFTINNFTSDQETILQHLVSTEVAQYLIYSIEHSGPRPVELPEEYSWTPHIQGYVQFYARKYQSACQSILRAAWFKANGTARENYAYITKGDVLTVKQYPHMDPQYDQKIVRAPIYFEFGSINSDMINGTPREKKQTINELIQKFDNINDFMQNEFCLFSKHMKALQYYYNQQDQKLPKNIPFVIWLAGPSGCGKSQCAHQISEYFDTRLWTSFSNLRWFDNLTAKTECVLFEDIRANDLSFNYLLRLLDRYDITVEQKGLYGGVKFNPKCIIITCPRVPKEEFINHQTGAVYEDIFQLERRCNAIIEYRKEPFKGWYYQQCYNEFDCCQDRYLEYIQSIQENWRIRHPETPEPVITMLQNHTQSSSVQYMSDLPLE